MAQYVSMYLKGYPNLTNFQQVKGEAQASDDKLQQFVGQLNKGPPSARVIGVETSDIPIKEGESGFLQISHRDLK
jgi:acylphosphatase